MELGAEIGLSQHELRMRMKAKAFGAALLAAAATLVCAGVAVYLLAPMRWPRAEGVVLSSAWVDNSGDGGRGATLEYSYQVNGRWYTSERLSLFRSANRYDVGSGQWVWDDRRLVDEHPQGSAIDVRYDPRQPSRAVVVAHANMPGLWGAGVVLAVFWIFAVCLWHKSRGELTEADVAGAGWQWGNPD